MTYAQRNEILRLWKERCLSTHDIAREVKLTEAEVYNVVVAYDHASAVPEGEAQSTFERLKG